MESNESIQISEEPTSKNFLTLKYVAIGILILILGFAGGIYFSRNFQKLQIESSTQSTLIPTPTISPQVISPAPESDEMAGWETYVNEKYGFEFEYPSDYFIEEPNSISREIVTVKNSNLPDEDKVKPGTTELFSNQLYVTFGLYEQSISPGDELDNWLKMNGMYVSAMSGSPLSTKDIFVNGYRGLELEYSGTGKYFVFTNDRKVFFAYYGPYKSEYSSVFDQILSTFEFTNPQ